MEKYFTPKNRDEDMVFSNLGRGVGRMSVLEYTEAAVRRCSSVQVFIKTSQISQENICGGVSF